mmetsp:Transcript_7694/g.11617  ORF Transcript_7694/g.11617 Transcript_7694/m.11617 type:complete len:460 (-) Transcript_7694:222-1601(-)
MAVHEDDSLLLEEEQEEVNVEDEKHWLSVALIGLGGIHYGFNVAVVGSLFDRIVSETDASAAAVSMLSSATLVGAVLGSPASGILANYFGRVPATLFGESLSIIGAISSYLSGSSFICLALGRFFVGLGVGICTLAKPIYVRETIQSEKMRSLIFSSFPVFVAFGIICAQTAALSPFFSWHCLLAVGGLPAFVLFILALGPMTESNVWLKSRALASSDRKKFDPTAQKQTITIEPSIERRIRARKIIIALSSGFVLAAGNQATGQYPITVYATEILRALPSSTQNIPQQTLLLNITNMLSALLAVFFVRASNVYIMLLCNNLLGAFGLVLSAFSFSSRFRFFGLLLKLLTHQIGPGSGYFVLVPELLNATQYPTGATIVYSVSNALRYFFEFSQSFGFLSALSYFGLSPILLFYSLVSLLCTSHAALVAFSSFFRQRHGRSHVVPKFPNKDEASKEGPQ